MIAPGLSIDTVRIPPLVVEVRHLVWKHRNHFQKRCRNFSQNIFKCVSKTLASKECTSFQNIGRYKNHMQSNNLKEAWPLILLSFTISKLTQMNARSCAGKVCQNRSTDWNVHFFKTFNFLAKMRPKWSVWGEEMSVHLRPALLISKLLDRLICTLNKMEITSRAQENIDIWIFLPVYMVFMSGRD